MEHRLSISALQHASELLLQVDILLGFINTINEYRQLEGFLYIYLKDKFVEHGLYI